jgi:putative transposase
MTSLSETLAPVSAKYAKNGDFKPFWNSCSKEVSSALWLPIKTGMCSSGLTSSHGCLSDSVPYWTVWTEASNQDDKSSSDASWKYLPAAQPDTSEAKEKTKEEEAKCVLRSRKVRIYPNKEQREIFKDCFGTARYFYNKTVCQINASYAAKKKEFEDHPTCIHCGEAKEANTWTCSKHAKRITPWNLDVSFISMRSKVMKSDKDVEESMAWQKNVPYDTRQAGINDACKAYKTSISLLKAKLIPHFELKPKRKKNIHQMFWINKKALTKAWDIFPRRRPKHKGKLRMRKRHREMLNALLPEGNSHYAKVQKVADAYYLIVSYDEKETPPLVKHQCIALDPGARTFQSGYAMNHECVQFGARQQEQIKKLHNRLDKLRSLRKKSVSKTKKRLAMRVHQVEKKVMDVVDNLHNQTASYLAKTYDTVVIGKFDSGRILKKANLSPGTNRTIQTLSHFQFRMKLAGVCSRYGSKCIVQNESYTTKTCGRCGCLNENMGGTDTFECKSCGLICDRDFHAARNILLKYLTASRQ